MTATELLAPADRRLALRATGVLAAFNRAGVLEAADVHVARRLGALADEQDENVQLALALTVRAVRNGSVCVDLGTVSELADDLPWPDPRQWVAAVTASPLVTAGVLRYDLGLLYLDRYHAQEEQVCADLLERADQPPPRVDEARLRDALDRLFADDEYTEQRVVAEATCRQWTSVITGGPGTGKTSTLARVLAVLAHSIGPLRVALAAPTGKAAARMAQAVSLAAADPSFPAEDRAHVQDLSAATLHRLLGVLPENGTRFRHHRGNKLPHDVVVVDETSMVALPMMARLLEAVRPDTRLVLVGDPDQLASVEAGAVLEDLVTGFGAGPDSPVRRLERVHRFGEQIGHLAAAVRDGEADAAWQLLTSGSDELLLVEPTDLDSIDRMVAPTALALAEAARSGDRTAAVAALDRHRLLCAHREGPYGVRSWNRRVERLLMTELGVDWLPPWYAGQPLLVNGNDYGLRLWNGDTGVVCTDGDGLVAVIADGSAPEGRELSLSRLADVSTAHAMTVHRSQGSQFDEVTVLLPDPDSRLLTRELLYTAVTRARRRVRVVGGEESVRAAVARRAERATGLARRLGEHVVRGDC